MPFWLCLLLAFAGGGALLRAAVDQNDSSRDTWLVRAWQSDQGLIDNTILGIAQTPDGYLWTAFGGGLTRFDGADFDSFFLQHIPDARNRVVRSLHLDRQGRFWISMSRGVLMCVGDERMEVFTPRDGLPRLPATRMAEDEAGTMWFTTAGHLFRIRGGAAEVIGDVRGLPAGGSWQIGNDIEGKLWCARGAELGFFRGGGVAGTEHPAG